MIKNISKYKQITIIETIKLFTKTDPSVILRCYNHLCQVSLVYWLLVSLKSVINLLKYVYTYRWCSYLDHARLERKAIEIIGSISNASIPLKSLPYQFNDDPTILQLDRQHLNSDSFLDNLSSFQVLINVAEFTQLFSLRSLFQLVNSLKTSAQIKQLWLWASPATICQEMVVPYLEHMSTSVLTLKDSVNMRLLTKKSGGLVSKKVKIMLIINEFII